MIPFPVSQVHPHSMANFHFSFFISHSRCCIIGVPCEGIFIVYNILGVFILELKYPCLIIFSVFYYGFPYCHLSFVFLWLLFPDVN